MRAPTDPPMQRFVRSGAPVTLYQVGSLVGRADSSRVDPCNECSGPPWWSGCWRRPAPPSPPGARRERKEPGLILEGPGRMAACDVLTFVRDGKDLYLLAAGDDKVV